MAKFDMLLPQDKVNYCSNTDFEVYEEDLGISFNSNFMDSQSIRKTLGTYMYEPKPV